MATYYDTPGIFYDAPGVYYDDATLAPASPPTMKKVKMPLARLSPNQTADLAEAIHTALTGNANFPAPSPTLAVILAALLAVRGQRTDISNTEALLRQQRADSDTLTATLKLHLRQLGDHVQDVSDGDAAKIHSANMEVTGDPQPTGPLTAPQNLVLIPSDLEGRLRARWRAVPDALTYVVETAPTPDGTWTQKVLTTRSDCALEGLTSGSRCWVRVRALGTPGLGPWSDVACRMAA